ncbi:SGNH/GDSL hydrolase family protein [Rhodococcus aetherivorans]|uniref:SGNH/GDSL hydrolase family protein n=2 Tax=Rhodococcus aetherivorans TaxID=191292 RepID=A0AA46SCH1_9NOCA|nr:SGNH/GDSL hydrolase family protein [Rhodococcus aetherivorans]UYF93021.1 SGNH/GDSL hydrolase family protein [Rhodococcus aetherivorans]
MKRLTIAPRTLMAVLAANVLVSALVATSVFAMTRTSEADASPLAIAVVGDEWSAGFRNRTVWPTLMAERTGWSVANFALPDSGFVADGQGGHAFTYQVDRADAVDPRVVLIVGGLGDTGLPDTEAIVVGATDAINKIIVGGRRPLLVGPTWFETPVPASVVRVSDVLRSTADEMGVPYLDALDPPLLTRDQMWPDLSGPTDAGQSALADMIAAWVRTQVIR